jgi:hypothetical protein
VGLRLGTVSLDSSPFSRAAAQVMTRAVSSAEAGAGRGFGCFLDLGSNPGPSQSPTPSWGSVLHSGQNSVYTSEASLSCWL